MRRVVTTKVDDLNESDDNVETVEFALDQIKYEIDLDETNRAELHEKLAKYVEKARIVPKKRKGNKKPKPVGETPKKYDREHSLRIRERAQFAGETVSKRGRLPDAIAEKYNDDAVVGKKAG